MFDDIMHATAQQPVENKKRGRRMVCDGEHPNFRIQWNELDATDRHQLIEEAQWSRITRLMQSRRDPSFTGTICLIDLDGCHSKRACNSAPPMPLTRRNRERLQKLGLSISDDGCWAIWQETQL